MTNRKREDDAIKILHKRYFSGKTEREAALDDERLNARIARLIWDYREEANLTQKQLADLVGTTQSVISRLEDADYDGHSLSMLGRIAGALKKRLSVDMQNKPSSPELRYAFQRLIYLCRLNKGWSIAAAAESLGISPAELYQLERTTDHRPLHSTLYALSVVYEVPQEKLAFLAGAFKHVPDELRLEATRFAESSDSSDKITADERKALNGFIQTLKTRF